MNTWIGMGRLVKDPDIRTADETKIARFTIAVDRRFKKEGDASADFIPCVFFKARADFIEKYVRKGTKVIVEGQIRTGNYTNKDGNKVYTTEIYGTDIEFAESKKAAESTSAPAPAPVSQYNAPQQPYAQQQYQAPPQQVQYQAPPQQPQYQAPPQPQAQPQSPQCMNVPPVEDVPFV